MQCMIREPMQQQAWIQSLNSGILEIIWAIAPMLSDELLNFVNDSMEKSWMKAAA